MNASHADVHGSSVRPSPVRLLLALVCALGLLVALAPISPASAAPSFNRHGVAVTAATVTVSGTTASTSFTLRTDRRVSFQNVVLAVRDAQGRNHDFGHRSAVTLDGTRTFTGSRANLAAGTYTARVAYRRNGTWTQLGPTRTVTVGRSTPAPAPAPAPVPAPAPAPSPTPIAPPSTSPSAPPAPGNWRLAFNDEFSGTSVDRTKWTDRSSSQSDGMQGNGGNNQQLEWNQMANCSVRNGQLIQTAKRESFRSPSGRDYSWTSCLLSSTPSYSFTYGYIEERAIFPAQRGFWPAFWSWQVPGGNQTMETDVYEYYSDNKSRLYLTSHVGSRGGCVVNLGFDPTTTFATYGADIRPDGTSWYVNGRKVCDAPGSPSARQNIITNLAVYANIPPLAGTTTAEKRVDYVRAWARS